MITPQHISYGWVNIHDVIVAKGNSKCKCINCSNKVKKGDKVVQLSSGNLCHSCSSLSLQTVEARYRRDIEKLKIQQKELDSK